MNLKVSTIEALGDLIEEASSCEIVDLGEFRHYRLTIKNRPLSIIQGLVSDSILLVEPATPATLSLVPNTAPPLSAVA